MSSEIHYVRTFGAGARRALLALLLAGLPARAQTGKTLIAGRAVDPQGKGIQGCAIAWSGSNGPAVISDSLGRFTVRIEGTSGLRRAPDGASFRIEGSRPSTARFGVSLRDAAGRAPGVLRNGAAGSGADRVSPSERASRKSAAPTGLELTVRCAGFADRAFTVENPIAELGDLPMQPLDQCPGDPAKTLPGACGCGIPEGSCNGIRRVGTTAKWDADGAGIAIPVPGGTRAGDLLLLALHRTDDFLPLRVAGWTRAAECFKTDNGFGCAYASTCKSWADGNFCREFTTGIGRDLAQAIYFKEASATEPAEYRFDLNLPGHAGHPGWIVLTALRGAATADPVRAWSATGCDKSTASVFPSVNAQAGDMLVLSQSFDDFVPRSAFLPPPGMEGWGYVGNSDETGFQFGRIAAASGPSGPLTTTGPGGHDCKDALISLSIRPR